MGLTRTWRKARRGGGSASLRHSRTRAGAANMRATNMMRKDGPMSAETMRPVVAQPSLGAVVWVAVGSGSASSRLRPSSPPRPTSSSPHAAARRCGRKGSRSGPDGARSRPCATGASSRSRRVGGVADRNPLSPLHLGDVAFMLSVQIHPCSNEQRSRCPSANQPKG